MDGYLMQAEEQGDRNAKMDEFGALQSNLNAANERIAELEAASGWVSVEDKLPDRCSIVILAGGIGFLGADDVWYSAFGEDYGRAIQWKVTYWMPLPETPSNREVCDE